MRVIKTIKGYFTQRKRIRDNILKMVNSPRANLYKDA